MKFAKYTFYIAGILGILVLLPQYFLEDKNNRDFPPAITHPEYYYGFVGVALAFQILFLIIAGNPVRYRGAMIAGVIEKFSFVAALIALLALGRVAPMMLAPAIMDFTFGVLFIIAYLKTPEEANRFGS